MRMAPISDALRARFERDNEIKRRFLNQGKVDHGYAPVITADTDWDTGVYDNSLGITFEDDGAKFGVFNWGKSLAWAFVSKADLRRLRDRLNSLDLD